MEVESTFGEWSNLTEDGEVKKKILQEGKGEVPIDGCLCNVYYEGKVVDGSSFDSIYNRRDKTQQFHFTLGQGQVIAAFEKAVKSMKIGEIALIQTSSKYGYGKLGCPPRIPGNAQLQFEIELLFIERPKTETKDIKSVDDRLKESEKEKMEGNEFFKANQFRKASKSYNKALALFGGLRDVSESDLKRVNAMKLTLHTNQAACCLKLDEVSKAIKHAEMAIEIDENNSKAHWRLGLAYEAADQLSLAKFYITKAAKLDLNNPTYREDLERINKKMELEKANTKSDSIFANIFAKK